MFNVSQYAIRSVPGTYQSIREFTKGDLKKWVNEEKRKAIDREFKELMGNGSFPDVIGKVFAGLVGSRD